MKKVLRQDHYFSTKLPYADIKITEIWMNMVITTYNSTEDIISKLQSVKGRTKLNFYENIIDYYDETNIRRQNKTFQFEEDPISKNAQSISKIYYEVLLLGKLLQTKSPTKKITFKH